MIDLYTKACLVLAVIAALTLLFPSMSHSQPTGDVNCSGLKTVVIRTMNRGQAFLKTKSELSEKEKSGEYLKFMQLAASFASIYGAFCDD